MLAFMKERPPLVVFFLCLLITSLTLFGFSFYIQNTDKIPDSDVIYDWNQLLKHMRELDICLNSENIFQKSTMFNQSIETRTIQTLVNVNITDFKRYSGIQGLITLDGWHPTCSKNHPRPLNLEIYFEVPNTPGNITDVDICVNIRGPSEYLPVFHGDNCMVRSTMPKLSIGYLNSTRKAKYDSIFCKGQTLTKISFYPQNSDLMANVLGSNVKNLIFIHLLWTSCILMFVILAILIYGIFQNDSKLDKYIEKCTNIIQRR